jgi:hypothetical protein
MQTQILISIDPRGLRDVALVADTPEECGEVVRTFGRFEAEILAFLSALKVKTNSEKRTGYGG